MFRAAHRSEESWSLLKEISEALGFEFQLAFCYHALGCLIADDERGPDIAGRVTDGAVTVGPIDVFELSVAIDGDELILVPGGFAFGHDGLDLRADDVPDLLPAFAAWLTERAGVLVFADAGPIGVVVKLDEVIAPPQEHGVARRQHGVDEDQQRLRPGLDGTDGGAGPGEGAG